MIWPAKQGWMPPMKSLLDGGQIVPLVARLRDNRHRTD